MVCVWREMQRDVDCLKRLALVGRVFINLVRAIMVPVSLLSVVLCNHLS